MPSRGRLTATLVALTGVALTASGCLGAKSAPSTASSANAGVKSFTLRIAANDISGGKNAAEADWITKYVIPQFEAAEKAKGLTAKVTFEPSGVADEQYKAKQALDLKTRAGADIIALDGIWIGEFAQAQYIRPLTQVVGAKADQWSGWSQITPAVQANMSFNGQRYGVPSGTDGRVLFYNKQLFARAGLPADWQPKSWQDILTAGQALKKLPGVTPLQINAGTAMGEATTMQGVLPLLVGTGAKIYDEKTGKWQGATPNIKEVLSFYQQIYGGGLGNPQLQLAAKGRDQSFADFAAGKIGVLLEGDYFWRSVVEPKKGIDPMPNRDQVVGYTLIPAMAPGKGINGQDFVSMSGGGGWVLNPNSKYPQQAWDLLTFMNSAAAIKALLGGSPRITARNDVNSEVLAGDPMLTFVSQKVLPLTAYRPGLAVYPQVSAALQQATADVVSGKSPDQAAQAYQQAVEKAVGAANVSAS